MIGEATAYARILTSRDKKTLSQKALKVAEEVGELAKVVNPYEGAHSTTHRFIDRSRILEEVVDTILCASSIAYELGFTDDECQSMLMQKLQKWDGLQVAESLAKYPLPYEIHVTTKHGSVPAFRLACERIGVKPVLLDLHLRDGGVMKDMMTSSVFLGDNAGSLREAERIAAGLRESGYEVVRIKIETVPWHPAAPSRKRPDSEMPKDCYFECHLNVICTPETEARLRGLACANAAHVSRNVFKRLGDGSFTLMVTLRSYAGTSEAFRERVDAFKGVLEAASFAAEKEIVEFSVYDTKVRHDGEWIGKAA
jgi:NTP pyrophosphatase (non-canonical NTP hydrolase)